MICRPQQPADGHARTSTRWSAGSASSRCARAATYAIKHTTRTAKALVQDAALPARRQHAAPRRGRPAARAQRDRPGHAAHHGAAVRRRVPPQPHHRQLHPHRRGHERDRRRGDDPRPVGTVTDEPRRARTSSGTRARSRAPSAGAPPDVARRDGVVHRPVGLGQVDGRERARAALLTERGVLTLHARRRQPPPRAQRRPRVHAPTTATENVRRVGEVARLFADAGVVALVPLISPYRAGRDRARALHEAAGLRVRRGVRRHAASRCASSATPRASTPRPGAGELTGLHRHRRPLRGAVRARAGARGRPAVAARRRTRGRDIALRPRHRRPRLIRAERGRRRLSRVAVDASRSVLSAATHRKQPQRFSRSA